MGAKGIRRRKPRHPLPPAHVPTESELTPPVMWPEKGSGFEADPYSPAGTAQRQWWLIQGIGRRGGAVATGARLVVLALFVVPIAVGLGMMLYRLATGG